MKWDLDLIIRFRVSVQMWYIFLFLDIFYELFHTYEGQRPFVLLLKRRTQLHTIMKSQKDDGSCLIVIRKVKRTMVQSICKFLPSPQITYRGAVWTTYELLLLLTIFIYPCAAQSWEKSGCHLVGKYHLNNIYFNIQFEQ